MKKIILAAVFVFGALVASAQYSVDWYKISGGGSASSGGNFSLSGTVGQPDASGPLTGGSLSVTGGFWSLIASVQTAGVPNLIIIRNGLGSVKVLWPATGNFTLQQNSSLATTNWATTAFTISNNGGTNFITITPPVGNLFFRLKQ